MIYSLLALDHDWTDFKTGCGGRPIYHSFIHETPEMAAILGRILGSKVEA